MVLWILYCEFFRFCVILCRGFFMVSLYGSMGSLWYSRSVMVSWFHGLFMVF